MDTNDRREVLAALEHDQWAHWTRWQIDQSTPEMTERWERQIATPYEQLTEREKDADREWADKVLEIVTAHEERELVCGVCYGGRSEGATMRAVPLRQALPIADDPHHFDFGPVIGHVRLPLCDICEVEEACILVADDGQRWTDWMEPK